MNPSVAYHIVTGRGWGVGEGSSPVYRVTVLPGGTVEPAAGSCIATRFLFGHCGSIGAVPPGAAINPSCFSSALAFPYVRHVTSGTVTDSGPAETVTSISVPFGAVLARRRPTGR